VNARVEAPTVRRPARASGTESKNAAGAASGSAADGAVSQRAAAFDDTIKLRSEILREVDVLDQLAVTMEKRDDALLRKFIEMI